MFQIQVVEKIKTHISCSVTFFEKCGGAREDAENKAPARGMLDK
jgi:hypothetical protein